MMEDKRKGECRCGSKTQCGEFIDGKLYVVCQGIGCEEKWLAKRSTDKKEEEK